MVVLDEATAFTDPENEAVIQASINELVKGKTLIVIAHRLSTIVGADKILVMDQGCIKGQGTHEELLRNNSLYRELWTAHISAKDIPGTEDMEEYKDYRFHIQQSCIGMLLGLLACLAVGVITAFI